MLQLIGTIKTFVPLLGVHHYALDNEVIEEVATSDFESIEAAIEYLMEKATPIYPEYSDVYILDIESDKQVYLKRSF